MMGPTPNSCVLYDVHVRRFVTFLVILILLRGKVMGDLPLARKILHS
jgi:hypothetical protein